MNIDADSPELWVIGAPVTIKANVANVGETDGSVEVQIHYASGGEFEMVAELTSVSIPPESVIEVELVWDTKDYGTGPHRLWVSVLSTDGDEPLDTAEFHVVLQPADAIYALIPEKKQTYGKIVGEVSAPQPVLDTRAIYPTPTPTPTATPTPTPTPKPRVDAEIIDMVSYPAEATVKGQWVEVFVEVRNNGSSANNIPVQLTFPSASKQPETKSAKVQPRQRAFVAFTWKTGNYEIGHHTLRADLLLGDNTTSGVTSRAITLELAEPVVTALIESVEASSESAVVGEAVTIAVTVRNTGLFASNIPVTLHFPAEDKQPETRKPRTEPGATVVETFTWRTSRYEPGEHVFRVEAPGSVWTFTVALAAPMSDFNVVETYAPDPDMPSVRGDWVEVSALVSNAGPQSGRGIVTLSDAERGEAMYRENLDLDAQETQTVRFIWKTFHYEPGIYNLQVASEGANDTNQDNNVAEVGPITILDDGNIAVGYGRDRPELQLRQQLSEPVLPANPNFSIGTISWEPEAPAVGDVVLVNVGVRNDGSRTGRIPVTLHFPSDEKGSETRKPRAGPGETAAATFTWRTGHYEAGDHTFRVEVPGDERSFTVALVAPTPAAPAGGGAVGPAVVVPPAVVSASFSIAGVSWSPAAPVAGEPVSIAVEISNEGAQAGSAPVTLYFPSADKDPETFRPRASPGETVIRKFTWLTGRYAPGTYTFRVEIPNVSRAFRITLLPPTVDFVVARLYPPNPAYPIVKGDWAEVATLVSNVGKNAGKATVRLQDLTEARVMYDQSVALGPGESSVVEFTWKTLRYDVGEHWLRVEAEAKYDVDTSNNYSEQAWAEILTNRDITLGFDGGNPESEMMVEASKPRIRSVPEVPAGIAVLNDAPSAIVERGLEPLREMFSVDPLFQSGPLSSFAADLGAQDYRMLPFLCAQRQQPTGWLQTHGKQCPGVWALVR